jgi:PEP-CTERM motif-containing protein
MRKLLLALAGAIFPLMQAFPAELDLSGSSTSGPLTGDVGGTAIFSEIFNHPTGTGVFEPFLTIDSHGNSAIENGYNTDGHTALFLDQQRPEWNNLLRLRDLAQVTIDNTQYYAFELDANEPNGTEKDGSAQSLISIDNIRIYTSPTDNTAAVGNGLSSLDGLGALRFALNQPLQNGSNFNINNWVKLSATVNGIADQNGHNGGQGFSDMVMFIPVSAFAGASLDDFVFLYDLNGVHFDADAKGNAAQAGFEEWRALVSLNPIPEPTTTALLAVTLAAFGFVGFRRRKA